MSIAPRLALLALGATLVFAAPARAAFHLWKIQEVFSSADGAVQFVELFCPPPNSGEFFLNLHTIKATSDGVPVTFTLDHNLSGQASTSGRTFLLATSGFSALAGGVAPDYTLPANFINPNAASISINFSDVDILTFTGAQLPKDGVSALVDSNPAGAANLAPQTNSPKNFAGAAGSVNLGGPAFDAGDFDEDGSVDADDLTAWRTGFGMEGVAVDHGDGDANDDHDVDGADFLTWQQELGATSVAAAHAAPEPATAALLVAALLAGAPQRRTRKQIRQRGVDG